LLGGFQPRCTARDLLMEFESPQKACEFMFKMRGKEAKFPHIEYMLLDVFIEGSGGVTDILIENLKKYNPKKQTIILIEIHEENTGGVVYRQIVLENEEFPMTRKPEDVDIKITGLRSCEIGTHVPEEADIKIIGLHWE